jgi:hypothetical protein
MPLPMIRFLGCNTVWASGHGVTSQNTWINIDCNLMEYIPFVRSYVNNQQAENNTNITY